MFNIGDKVRIISNGFYQYKTGVVKEAQTRPFGYCQVHFCDIGEEKHWFYENELELVTETKKVDENYSTVRIHVSRMNREELGHRLEELSRRCIGEIPMIHFKAFGIGFLIIGGVLGVLVLFCTALDFYPKVTFWTVATILIGVFSYILGRAILEIRSA